jgi:hypothetical protein
MGMGDGKYVMFEWIDSTVEVKALEFFFGHRCILC